MPWKNKEAEKEYKRKYYLENKDNKSIVESRKKACKKWRQNNRLKVNKYSRDRYDTDYSKKYWSSVKDKYNEIGRIETENLSEKYMIKHLKKLGYTVDHIKDHPELIDTHRIIIKTKRLWKRSLTSGNLEKA